MYTPSITRYRKNLRSSICSFFPNEDPAIIFRKICRRGSQVITIPDLEVFCEKVSVPAGCLDKVFAPYKVKNVQISKNQFIQFMYDDLPHEEEAKIIKTNENLTKRQIFLLSKFVGNLRTKFGNSTNQRWASALARNPPNTLNTMLRLSALCHLFYEMNLPFTVSEFIDAMFAFYGSKIEAINFMQFQRLFSAFP